jgi:hypothetical protein
MGATDSSGYWDARGAWLLWFSVLSGPAAWALNQLIGYALVKPVCAAGAGLALALVSAAALALVAVGGWTAWSCLVRVRGAGEFGEDREARSQFLAIAGLGLNGIIGLLILTAAVPPFLLSPCE